MIANDYLKHWAENVAVMASGHISADALYAAAVAANEAGKDLNDPAVRRSLVESAKLDTAAFFEAELKRLVDRVMANPATEYGKAFRERQVELFDFNWKKRDPAGYAALEAECAELRRKQLEAGEQNDRDFERIKEIRQLLKQPSFA